jgi:hypothetical protein
VAENVLGTIFSRADALKRQLYDMIRNPSDYASMVGGRTQENMAAAQALQNEAFADPQNPLRITNPQALSQLTQMITSGPLGFAPAGIVSQKIASKASSEPVKRSDVQAEAKNLGLPATGKTEEIQELIGIVKSDPRSWSREQYELIRPHLAIHQDFRPSSAERSESIMREGLRSGMVDYLEPIEKGQYSYSRGLIGSDAYLFPSRGLKYKSPTDPHLAPGNIPLFKISPQKGQDIYEAIVTTAERRPENLTGLLE